jgi:acetyl esterase/lipase
MKLLCSRSHPTCPPWNNSLFRAVFLVVVLGTVTARAQSWVQGSPPNDSVATTYFPYLATETANVKYGSHNSSEVGDIYVPNYNGKPTPANANNRPAVIVVHGGGGTSGSRASAREIQMSQFLAAHGYVAFNIDYTLGAVWPKDIYDWRLAIRYLRANAATYGIDTNHIGVVGGSFGGFCAANLVGITNGQHTIFPDSNANYNNISLDGYAGDAMNVYSGDVQCGLDLYGPVDQVTSGNASGIYSSPTTATLKNSSAIYYVHPTSAPLMIAHGTADGTVNYSQSQEMTNYLGQFHVPYKFYPQSGQGHSFLIYQSGVDLRQKWMDFFDTYLLASTTPPYVQVQPADQTGCVGNSASFSVTAGGTTPLAYQWYGPSGAIASATNSVYSNPSLVNGNAGNYFVIITNLSGAVTSSIVTLTINSLTPPAITNQPVDITVAVGSPASLTAAATGDALNYQWYLNDQPIANATNATYSLVSAANADAGTYQVIVYNSCQAVASATAVLTVNGPPVLTAQPVAVTTCSGDSATFSATAIGTAPLNYQWFGPSGALGGATTASVTLTNLTTANSGNYYLVVTNAFGSATTSNALLTVSAHTDVTFTAQPTNVSVNVGGSASFTVTVSGGGNYNYLWLKNDYDTITGTVATNATLVVSNLALADSGTWYHCLVGNDCSIFSSANAYVTVNSTNSASVVIAEIYAAGGKSTAIYSNDYVVLKNIGGAAQNINGWSLQHQKAGTWQAPFALPNVTIPAGGYYLIKCYNDGSGVKGTTALPVPDASTPQTSAWNLSVTGSGAVALVNNVNQLTQNNTNVMSTTGVTNIVDVVGYVATTTTNSYIGTGVAPGGSSAGTNSTVRLSGGCQNTPDNSLDFTLTTPNPRNSATAPSLCGFAAPSISANPLGQTNFVGNSLSLAVAASGSTPLNYFWFKDGNFLTGNATANSALLNISPATTNDSGAYFVIVTNFIGSVTSTVANVLITNLPPTPPSITTPPQNTTVYAGSGATFSVTASGTLPLSYQWRRGGVAISGANSNSYTLNPTSTSDSGSTFDVIVSNNYGSVTSSPPATLTVNAIVTSGTVVIAEVYAGGGKSGATYNRDYVVLKNISASTVSLNGWSLQHDKVGVWQTPFALPNASIPPGSYYLIQCYYDGGTAAGAALPTPDATATQSSVWNMSYSSADAVALVNSTATLASCSDSSIIDLVGAGTTTGNCYLGAGVTPAGASAVDAMTRLNGGCQNSSDNSVDFVAAAASPKNSATTPVSCSVPNQPPTITTQPLSHVTSGPATSFSVVVAGTAPFAYQWFAGASPVSGATNVSYTLNNVTTNNSGNTFYVVVTNLYGAVTSSVAVLTVDPTYNELLSLEAVKAHYYLQTNTTAVDFPVASGGTYSWAAEVQGILPAQITGTTVSYNGTNLPNPFVQSAMDDTGLAQDELFYATKSALDMAFNNGNFHYVTTFDSGNTYVNDLPLGTNGDAYPNVPTLTAPAGDWSAGKLTVHAVTGGYGLSWVPLAAPQDQINIAINDAAGNAITELDGLSGSLTNYILPGSILDPNKDYQLELTFTHMNYIGTNSVGTILYGLFEANNDFKVHTDPAGVAGGVQATNYATVRNGTNSLNDINEPAFGYLMAKYSTSGSSAKAYLQFNLTGENYDTTQPATLRLYPGAGGGSQRVQIWALNQAFTAPTNLNNLNWNQAPANDTNGNGMLTGGVATASLLTELQLANATNEVIIPAPWGQFVFNNQLTLVIGTSVAIAGDVNSSAGFRIAVTNGVPLPALRFSSGPVYSQFFTSSDSGPGFFSGENLLVYTNSGLSIGCWSSSDLSVPVTSWVSEGTLVEHPDGVNPGFSRYGITVNPGASPVYYIFALTNTGPYLASESLAWLTTSDYVSFNFTGTNLPISANGVFQLPAPPSVLQPPQSQTVLVGNPAMFSVMAGGSTPLAYQWRLGGVPIGGANATNYVINSVAAGNGGSYDVVITNNYGAVTSSIAVLTVSNPVPVITQQPASESVLAGQNASFNVAASGPGLNYQWQRNSSSIPGANSGAINLTNVTVAQAGGYNVVVTNNFGAATSSVATLAVSASPSLTFSAAGGTIQMGGGSLTGLTYVVQFATNLDGPAWTPVLTNNTGSNGTINFTTNTSSGPVRYYRIMFP